MRERKDSCLLEIDRDMLTVIPLAERTACMLLPYADLLLMIRTRGCVIFGCSEERDCPAWARAGARAAALAASMASETRSVERELLE